MTNHPSFSLSHVSVLLVFTLMSACGDSDPPSNGDAGEIGDGDGDGDGDGQDLKYIEGFVYQCLGANCPAGPCVDSVRAEGEVSCRQAYPDVLGENTMFCKVGLVGNYAVKVTPDDTRDWKQFRLIGVSGG